MEARQPYTSDQTLELIKERQTARNETRLADEWKLSRKIKNSIRKDKRKYREEFALVLMGRCIRPLKTAKN